MENTDAISLTYGQAVDLVSRIEQLPPLTGTGAPTTSTPAWYVGQRYIDTQNNNEYYCVELSSSGVVGYVWLPVDTSTSYTGGDGINIDAQNVISATNTGKARVLTTDDYNWPTNNPTSVALWLLPNGLYSAGSGATVRINTDTTLGEGRLALVDTESGAPTYAFISAFSHGNQRITFYDTYLSTGGNGSGSPITNVTSKNVIDSLTSTSTTSPLSANQGKNLKDLIDSLVIKNAGAPTTSTVGTVGMLLEDTTNGKLYQCIAADTVTPSYIWEEVGKGSGVIDLNDIANNYPTNNPTGIALWMLPAGVYVSSTGTRSLYFTTTDLGQSNVTSTYIIGGYDESDARGGLIISPSGYVSKYYAHADGTGNRVSLLDETSIYSDQYTNSRIRIGQASTSNGTDSIAIGSRSTALGTNTIAIGKSAEASQTYTTSIGNAASASNSGAVAVGYHANAFHRGSVALGAYSGSNNIGIGEVHIGSSDTNYGYNSSNYRLLTGLYDGQSDHDAVTVGQLNTAIAGVTGAEEITSEDWSALWQ